MLLDLYIYPHPILAQTAEPVEAFDAELETLAANMLETMYEGLGVGLAAPQVGISRRLFVVDSSTPDEEPTPRVYVNPRILKKDSPVVWNEGCLSLPGLYRDVKTFEHVVIEAYDIHGEKFTEEAEGLRAVALLHEYGHLDGQVFVDRLTPIKRRMAAKFWAKHVHREAERVYKDCKLHCVFANESGE